MGKGGWEGRRDMGGARGSVSTMGLMRRNGATWACRSTYGTVRYRQQYGKSVCKGVQRRAAEKCSSTKNSEHRARNPKSDSSPTSIRSLKVDSSIEHWGKWDPSYARGPESVGRKRAKCRHHPSTSPSPSASRETPRPNLQCPPRKSDSRREVGPGPSALALFEAEA